MQVVSPDDDGTGHLGRDDLAREDAATDRDVTSERALLVYERAMKQSMCISG